MIIDPNICRMFRSGKSHLSQTSTENADIFRRISSPKHFLKCPKLERQDFWPRFLPPRPRAIFPLCVHRGAFGQQELCSINVAFPRRHVERRFASGAFSGKPSAAVASGVGRLGRLRGNDERCGQLSSTGSTDCFGLTIFETVQSNIYSQTKCTSFNTSFLQMTLPLMKGNVRTCFSNIEKASKNNVINYS